MTEKELKKLNRYQLLELLLMQTERADRLQILWEQSERKLRDQEIKIASLGSIAEASLELQGIFQSAQQAADQYVNAAKKQSENMIEHARNQCVEILTEALEDARHIKEEAYQNESE